MFLGVLYLRKRNKIITRAIKNRMWVRVQDGSHQRYVNSIMICLSFVSYKYFYILLHMRDVVVLNKLYLHGYIVFVFFPIRTGILKRKISVLDKCSIVFYTKTFFYVFSNQVRHKPVGYVLCN